jgi:hypothetical protein
MPKPPRDGELTPFWILAHINLLNAGAAQSRQIALKRLRGNFYYTPPNFKALIEVLGTPESWTLVEEFDSQEHERVYTEEHLERVFEKLTHENPNVGRQAAQLINVFVRLNSNHATEALYDTLTEHALRFGSDDPRTEFLATALVLVRTALDSEDPDPEEDIPVALD